MYQPSNTASSHYDSATFSTTLRDLVRDHLASLRMKLSSTPRFSPRWSELANDYRSTHSTLDELALEARTGRNHHAATVTVLPAEILLDVFARIVETERPCPPLDKQMLRVYVTHPDSDGEYLNAVLRQEPDLLSGRGGCLGWLTLGHVSSFWRRILLAQPRFWAQEIGSLPLGIDTITRRACNASLTLNLYASLLRTCRPYDLVVAFLKRNNSTLVPRIREMNLVNTETAYLDSYVFQNEYPHLDTLRIHGSEKSFINDTIKAPALRKAHFTNLIPTVQSSVLRDVLVDRTYTGSVESELDVNTADQQNLLRNSATSLVRLRILNVLVVGSRPGNLQIFLPKMQHLHIASTSASAIFPLIGGVVLPNTALLSLDIDFRNYRDGDRLRSDISALLSAARMNELSPTGIAILDTIRHHDDKTHRVEIELYTTPAIAFAHMDPASGPFAGQTHRLSLHSNYESEETEWSLIIFLDALESCVSFNTVDTLSYQGCCDTCASTVDPILLARFPNVRTLQLADAQSRCLRVMESLCGTSPALPGLEYLWLTQRSDEHVLQRVLLAQQLLRRCAALRDEASEDAARLKRLRVDGAVGLDEDEDEDEESQTAMVSLKCVVDEIQWSL